MMCVFLAALKTSYQSLLLLTLLAPRQHHSDQLQFWEPQMLTKLRLEPSRQSMQAWAVGGCPGDHHSSLGASGSSRALHKW